ncbi:hypothetical protein BDV19DRAFT_398187 [Aspergillus venezuelensis]
MSSTTSDHVDYEPLSSQDPPFPQSPTGAGSPAKWGIGWRCPTLMIGFVICATALSMGHHFYYNTLNNTVVESVDQQTWAIRVGTGIAFLSKSFLVSGIGIAAVQVIWATLRRKSLKLSGIDAMFAILNSPMALFTPDVWVRAKTLTLLALISWLIPLTAVITPATLSIRLLPANVSTVLNVPNVNFTDAFWADKVQAEGAGFIYSSAPSISRLFAALASSAQVLPVRAPFVNSSYTVSFHGPSYKCQSLDEALVTVPGVNQSLWENAIGDVPEFGHIYTGVSPSSPENTFYVRSGGMNPLWNNNLTQPARLVCQLWNTSYVINLRFTNGTQTLTPISIQPFAYFDWVPADDPFFLSTGAGENGAYHVIHLLTSGLILGTLATGSTGTILENKTASAAFTRMSLGQTGLYECPELWNTSDWLSAQSTTLCRNKTLARAIEDLSHNFTFSLLSLNGARTISNVTDLTLRNFYSYNSRNLLIAYATSLGVSVACIIVGCLALWHNGISQSASFSNILMTTRNTELDHLAVGHCLGSDHLEKEAGGIRLQFGEIEGVGLRRKHAAFGIKGSVTALTKGEDYY